MRVNTQLNRCFFLLFQVLAFLLELTKSSCIRGTFKYQWGNPINQWSPPFFKLLINVCSVFGLCCLITVGYRCWSDLSGVGCCFSSRHILSTLFFQILWGQYQAPTHLEIRNKIEVIVYTKTIANHINTFQCITWKKPVFILICWPLGSQWQVSKRTMIFALIFQISSYFHRNLNSKIN